MVTSALLRQYVNIIFEGVAVGLAHNGHAILSHLVVEITPSVLAHLHLLLIHHVLIIYLLLAKSLVIIARLVEIGILWLIMSPHIVRHYHIFASFAYLLLL